MCLVVLAANPAGERAEPACSGVATPRQHRKVIVTNGRHAGRVGTGAGRRDGQGIEDMVAAGRIGTQRAKPQQAQAAGTEAGRAW